MLWHDRLRNRYRVEGNLVAQTGLHIGTGEPSPATDAPVIRTAGAPFLPGSSLKGVMRSAVERLAPNLEPFWSCALIENGSACIGSHEEVYRDFRALREDPGTLGRHSCPCC